MFVQHAPEVNIKYSDEASKTLQCIFEVQQQVTVEEGGENKQGGRYKYARLPDMQNAIRSTLAKYRCVYLFGTTHSAVQSEYVKLQGKNDPTARDKLVTFAYWSGVVTLVCIDNTKDWVKVSGFGFKVDQISDKALGAETIGKRYLLAELFGFTTGDDPDSDESDVRRFNSEGGNTTDVSAMLGGGAKPTTPAPAKTNISQFLS